jgi:spore germination protein GerM
MVEMRRLSYTGLVLVLVTIVVACAGGRNGTRVFFIDGYVSDLGMRGRLVARERPLDDPGLGRVVAEVLRGPTATEQEERGLISGFAPGVRVSTVALVDGTAKLNLSSETSPRRWPDGFYATAQLVYTVTELPGVERVVLMVNGVRCCVYDTRRRPWTKPLTREFFEGWQGAPRNP